MQIKKLPGDLYEENTYVLSNSKNQPFAVVDPGCDISKYVDTENIKGIFLTHAHIDHILYAYDLAKKCGAPIYLHILDKEIYEEDNLCLWDASKSRDVNFAVSYFDDGAVFDFGENCVSFVHTPGHTPGSVCYMADGAMFSGDTIMRGSVGRFDLPMGNMMKTRETCEKLARMQENYLIYPGHGPVTSLNTEQKFNPYLRGLV